MAFLSEKRESGFSLVELSVVIVIIGLIVAGVVGGQGLVNQAKLRSVAADFQKYETAINTFFLSYDQLPGDFSMAQANWGAGVNNGNNNRFISCEGGGDVQRHEAIDFWEHLYKAEILPTQYIGVSAPSVQDTAVGGSNVPKSSFALQVFSIFSSRNVGFSIFNKKIFGAGID